MKCVFRSPASYAAAIFLLASYLSCAEQASGEVCITQSQMKPADRDSIAATARTLAAKVQSDDAAGLRAQMVPEYAKDFSAMTALVGSTAPKVKDAVIAVDQVYVLDASNLKTAADGTNQDAQFFCSLNKSVAEANFLIPALPPGRYALAIVNAPSANTPWRLSFLLRQDQAQGTWSMAGFYPRALTAAGHEGLWYWTQARDLVKSHQLWAAYLYYQEAQTLLQPTGFTSSTHLDKLRREALAGAPPALSDGISVDAPLVVKSAKGAEYRFTGLGTDDSLGGNKLDVVVHLAPEPASDPPPASDAAKKSAAKSQAVPPPAAPESPRDRNNDAMAALLAAYPELRNNFHGVWVFAEEPGKNPFVTEEPMAEIH